MRLSIAAFALLMSAPSLRAADFFVDAALGDDTLGTGSSASPWKTISFSLTQVPSTGNVLHVAAGTYDGALGESFPIYMQSQVSVVGAGPGNTVVDAGPGAAAFEFGWPQAGAGVTADTTLENLTIHGQNKGVVTGGFLGQQVGFGVAPTLRDLSISVGTVGISVDGNAGFPTLQRCDIGPAARGLEIHMSDTDVKQLVLDCSIHDCAIGIDWDHLGNTTSPAQFNIARSELVNNKTGLLVQGQTNAGTEFLLTDSLIAGGATGIELQATNDSKLTVRRSTISGHSLVGIKAPAGWSAGTITSSIVWGNGPLDIDLSSGAPLSVAFSDVAGGGFAGTAGNIDTDPLFVNPAMGDWHLQPSSPCIDAGTAFLFPFNLDGELDARPLNQTGSAQAALDMGWDEVNGTHISVSGSGLIGTNLTVLTTAPGPSATLAMAAFETSPFITQSSGWFQLNPLALIILGSGTAPSSISVAIPPLPSLSGFTVYFQAYSFDTTTLKSELSNRADKVLH